MLRILCTGWGWGWEGGEHKQTGVVSEGCAIPSGPVLPGFAPKKELCALLAEHMCRHNMPSQVRPSPCLCYTLHAWPSPL